MAENSKIEWTDHTFNPWMGCTKVSPACKNCYAERDMDHRYGKVQWGPSGTRVVTSTENWNKPLKWNREAKERGIRYRVFCASLADVFEDWEGTLLTHKGDNVLVCDNCGRLADDGDLHASCQCGRFLQRVEWAGLDDVRKNLFQLIDNTPNLDWLLLTKRPENITKMLFDPDSLNGFKCRKNVWFGTSVENNEYMHRIDSLKSVGLLGSVLFLSCEPLLGPMTTLGEHLDGIDWVIAGGESGANARPSHPDWFRDVRDQCESANVPFHFKQWGEWLPIDHANPSHDGATESSVWRDKPSKDDLPMLTLRVGKNRAGRILDDRTHDGLPLVAETV
jgi:protein gp37